MRRIAWLACSGVTWLLSCGSDEAIAPAPKPEVSVSPDAGVDVCVAANALFSVPGVPERLCALNQSNDDATAVQQCQICAATSTAIDALLPALSCPTQLANCPVEDATLHECFEDVGQIMVDTMPGCAPSDTPAVDPTSLALRVATSSCGPVLLDCPPLQQLVFSLLGATF
jgi:hypothetical protein